MAGMNILYLCADPGISIRGHKGAAVHVRALADAFAALGHRVAIVTPRPGSADGPAPVAQIVEAPSTSNADVCRAARELLASEPFDFIYERYSLWSDTGAQLAEAAGLPLVVEVNAPLRLEAARYRGLSPEDSRRAAAVETRLLSAAAAVAVVSEPLRQYVAAQGVPPDRIHVLPNAVDERYFHPAVDGKDRRAALGLADKFVVGFVGTVRPWHDLDTLLNAHRLLRIGYRRQQAMSDKPYAILPDYHLLLVGDVPDSIRAATARRGLDDSTTIVGPVPHDQVPAFIAAMDVAVSPHPAMNNEGADAAAGNDFYFSPLKLCEYLACGVATVAADLPPIATVISHNETGLLYPPGDDEALAKQIAAVAANPDLRSRLGWQGAVRVLRHHTWLGNARQIINILSPDLTGLGEEQRAGAILDDKLRRRLYRATRPDAAESLLAKHFPGTGRLTGLQTLKYKPRRRCVIAYEFSGLQIIGKLFRDERGARLFAIQQTLWRGGFGLDADDRITVAEPLAYVPELRMFAQERAPGRTLDESLTDPDFSGLVRLSASALAKLHTTRAVPEAVYPLSAELANLEHWAAELAAWRPERAPDFARQLDGLRALASALPPADPGPAHRDFYYSQLLFDGRRVTLIDLDMFARADQAIDVANFTAHLQFLAMQRLDDPRALDGAAALFVAEYVRRRGRTPEFSNRFAFYEAATFFRLLHVVLQRPQLAHCFEPLFKLADEKTASPRP